MKSLLSTVLTIVGTTTAVFGSSLFFAIGANTMNGKWYDFVFAFICFVVGIFTMGIAIEMNRKWQREEDGYN